MLQDEIVKILQKYNNNIWCRDVVNNIDIHISELIIQLKEIRNHLRNNLYSINLSDSLEDDNFSKEILSDIKVLKREIIKLIDFKKNFLSSADIKKDDLKIFNTKQYIFIALDDLCVNCNVKLIQYKIDYQQIINDNTNDKSINGYICPCCQKLFMLEHEIENIDFNNTNIVFNQLYKEKRKLVFQDIIVLTTLKLCTTKGHNLMDVIAEIPIFDNNGNIDIIKINISYREQCKRYIMLKSDFKRIEGIVACRVIDETKQICYQNGDEIEIRQKESILYQYGYNVKTKDNLSSKQRHLILASVVELDILTREQICSHLNILIERGSKIEKWKLATQKWKQDRQFVKKYNTKNLPQMLFDTVILKYRQLTLNI